jgi:hypothetical protein
MREGGGKSEWVVRWDGVKQGEWGSTIPLLCGLETSVFPAWVEWFRSFDGRILLQVAEGKKEQFCNQAPG